MNVVLSYESGPGQLVIGFRRGDEPSPEDINAPQLFLATMSLLNSLEILPAMLSGRATKLDRKGYAKYFYDKSIIFSTNLFRFVNVEFL